ncbi:MurR/RpiR family transcriptional regulator [Amycolatopsis thermophila]|uniref:DNA-binding MurR/RpiR family transcriptional regulator n=1 Tax=Amycolatopsis thermophila TaxID=206084 RepID=A0ABU0EUL3_9PSEU|nr:MurR/RpiR family transcriptional regulator [Amycolatopsis thermophila]MDQ0379004.1 DNA-binding MurR/RpiR family transcriptional regulator [Amycolatopsis thermophila]
MKAPGSYQELAELLRSRLPKLASGQLRIAHLLLADPEGTAYRGISEAAKLLEVRESSVTRFANSLGLPGYPDVMELCRTWVAEQAQVARRTGQAGEPESPGGLLSATLEQEQTNLARTFGQVERPSWLRAVELLAEAPRVHVIGLRECRAVADLAAQRLGEVLPAVHRLGGGSLPDELKELCEDEVLLAISIRRYAADTVRVVSYARETGLPVVALTDNPASPLAESAEVALFAETSGVSHSRSLTALLAVAQALVTEVALKLGDPKPDHRLLDTLRFYY